MGDRPANLVEQVVDARHVANLALGLLVPPIVDRLLAMLARRRRGGPGELRLAERGGQVQAAQAAVASSAGPHERRADEPDRWDRRRGSEE